MSPAALAAIEALRRLPANWDSYGAERPDESTLVRARDCLSSVINTLGYAYGEPAVQPLADPGVALIWRDRWRTGGEVEVLVTPRSVEWVILRDQRVVKHGPIDDPAVFAREILKPNVSL
jgi:hypothetical protein